MTWHTEVLVIVVIGTVDDDVVVTDVEQQLLSISCWANSYCLILEKCSDRLCADSKSTWKEKWKKGLS